MTMARLEPQLIVALDVDTFQEASTLVNTLSPVVDFFKIGSQLFTSCGPVIVRYVQAKGKEVFLDLKYHDIPNTVASAVSAAIKSLDVGHKESLDHRTVFMYTLHIAGGEEMLKKSVEAAQQIAQERAIRRPLALGITVLTSDCRQANTQALVLERALIAQKAGLDGVVASVEEAAMLRKEFGKEFVIVTPGIRPLGADVGDQKRVATPALAIKNGSNFLVVGRPIVKAQDPLKAAQDILDEMKSAYAR